MANLRNIAHYLPPKVDSLLAEHKLESKGAAATADTAGVSVGVWLPEGYTIKPSKALFESSQLVRTMGNPELDMESIIGDIFDLSESVYRVNLLDELGNLKTVTRKQFAEVV